MKTGKFLKIISLFLTVLFVFSPALAISATKVIDASTLIPRVSLYLSPKTGTFIEGSTFDVPILLDTKGLSINGVDVRISFDQNKLTIIKPSSGQSIIGVWVEPPAFNNTNGTASYVGVIPNGIVTDSGLVGTITFQAKATGKAVINVRSNSDVLLNDGVGTSAVVDLGRVEYTIIPKPPEGVRIYSETHPFSGDWYNNNSPVFSWDRDPGVAGFSFALDDKPTTIPENTVMTNEVTKSYEKLTDGLWYFHVKAFKNGVWGTTGHFLVRIDTAPPAEFTPQVNYVLATVAFVERALVSFFTTDNLSGIDHYEVGVIDKSQPLTESPAFIQTESPYQVSADNKVGLRVIVRAVDKAGNIRDVSVDVKQPFGLFKWIGDHLTWILLIILLILLLLLLAHYLFGHHIVSRMKRAMKIVEAEDKNERPKLMNTLPKKELSSLEQLLTKPPIIPVKPTEPKIDFKPKIDAQPKPESKQEIKPEIKPEPKIETKPEAKPQPQLVPEMKIEQAPIMPKSSPIFIAKPNVPPSVPGQNVAKNNNPAQNPPKPNS